MSTQVISINVANIITIMIIALVAFAASNFIQAKTGVQIPFVS
jgi:hypothetical protein